MADLDSSSEDVRPSREGLPPSYRMRADPHYVDLLASPASPAGRERSIPVASFQAPDVSDVPALVPLIESVRQHGVLQPLIVNDRGGTLRVIAGQRRLAAAIAAGLREVPCLVQSVDDETAARLRAASNVVERQAADVPAAQPADHASESLSKSIGTAASLADLITGSISDLSRGVVGGLLRAELFRAASLVQFARVVRDDVAVVKGAVPVAALVERVVQAFAPERRLRNVDLLPHVDLPSGHIVIADERLVAAALHGAAFATLALIDTVHAARLSLVAGLTASRQLTLIVSQDHVLPGSAWAERAFDGDWRDRPGGSAVALGMLAVQRAAKVHGGEATATLSPRGTRVALTIPAGA